MEEVRSIEYTYELGQVAGILANHDYTLEKILEYKQEAIENLEFEKNHGIDPARTQRNIRIWNACIALLKPAFTL